MLGNFWATFHFSSNFFSFRAIFEQLCAVLSNVLQFQDQRFSECGSKAIRTFSSIFRTSPKIYEICRRFPRKFRRCFNFWLIQHEKLVSKHDVMIGIITIVFSERNPCNSTHFGLKMLFRYFCCS